MPVVARIMAVEVKTSNKRVAQKNLFWGKGERIVLHLSCSHGDMGASI